MCEGNGNLKMNEMVSIPDYVCKNNVTGDEDDDVSEEDCATKEGYTWSERIISCQEVSDYFSVNPQSCSDSLLYVSTCCDDVQPCNIKQIVFLCVPGP